MRGLDRRLTIGDGRTSRVSPRQGLGTAGLLRGALPGELLILRRLSQLLRLCTVSTAVLVILVGLLLGR